MTALSGPPESSGSNMMSFSFPFFSFTSFFFVVHIINYQLVNEEEKKKESYSISIPHPSTHPFLRGCYISRFGKEIVHEVKGKTEMI